MFETPKTKIELIIVCDDKTMTYGRYLMQLIGQNDDNEDSVVGTKDGFVSAAIYTEKQYNDTMAKISSNTHVLFIGNNKTTKSEGKFIPQKIDSFGLHFGSQGKRAVMYVDKSVKKSDYNEFVEFASKYQLEFKKANNVKDKVGTAGVAGVAGVAGAAGLKGLGALGAKAVLPAAVGGPVGWLLSPILLAPPAIYGIVKSAKAKEEHREQQYRCLILAMYMEHLQNFLED